MLLLVDSAVEVACFHEIDASPRLREASELESIVRM